MSSAGNNGGAAGGADDDSSLKSLPPAPSFSSLSSVVTWLPVKQVHILEQQLLTNIRPPDVKAELNDDNQLGDLTDDKTSVIGEYQRMVYDRVHTETTGVASRSTEELWLVKLLK